MGEYRRLDLNSLIFSDDILSYEEAIENATPLNFDEEVVSGKKKISITKAEKDSDNRCVKLEISC